MSSSNTYRTLPGADNLKARTIYNALKAHHKASKTHQDGAGCPMCTAYTQYGCSIVRGDLLQHVADVVAFPVARADLTKLQEAKLIKIEPVTRNQHRIVFVELAPREAAV